MVKTFKESYEKVRDWLLTVGVRQNQKKHNDTYSQKRSQTYCRVHEGSYLTSVDSGHVSDGDWGFLPVHETNQAEHGLRYYSSACTMSQLELITKNLQID